MHEGLQIGIFRFSAPSSRSHDCTLSRERRLPRIATFRTSRNAISCVPKEVVANPTVTNITFSDTSLGPTGQWSHRIAPRIVTRKASSWISAELRDNPTWREASRFRGSYAVPIPTFPRRSCLVRTRRCPFRIPGFPASMFSGGLTICEDICDLGIVWLLKRWFSQNGWRIYGS